MKRVNTSESGILMIHLFNDLQEINRGNRQLYVNTLTLRTAERPFASTG